jgi:isoleucyl-tRNA synthetase
MENLRGKGLYYKKEKYFHDYPHCWRCSTPLLFRAVDEWYIDMSWRREIMEVAKQIRWIPEWGLGQELNWLENMGDWMISKKRFWGLALPIFECECGCFDVVGGKEELKERAVEGWEEFEGHSPHRPWVDAIRIRCDKCGKLMGRIPDVGNPWLDAGIVPYSTVRYKSDQEYWRKWIPADLVLECFPGQFRNWFYALLSMSTMMEGIAPFGTLLGHALVRDEQGREMHKSAGNAIWFDDAVERMGADVMRWIFCGHNPTNNLNFGYGVGEQVRRRTFNTWWNVYSFFVNYARLDGFDPRVEAAAYENLQDIDRWLLSKLCELTRVANEALAGFNVHLLVQQAEDFIERLSNWYVRRNRRRYWRPKSESDEDKRAAYQTLYRVLVELCKLLAPVVPFVAERMYQNLVRSFDSGAPESVHHCEYPEVDESLYNAKLAGEMDMVADVVSRTLSVREGERIRVRQPLRRLIVAASDESREALKSFESHVLDELNVKGLEFVESVDKYVSYEVRPNAKTVGPRFGKEITRIAQLLGEKSAKEMASTVGGGETLVLEADGKRWELAPEDIVVEWNFPDSLVLNDAAEPVLLLDTEITEELRHEGYARDLVRHVQQIRKEIGLEIQDRIKLRFESSHAGIQAAINQHKDYICEETLCNEIEESGATRTVGCKEVKIGGGVVKLAVTKAG